MRLFHTTLFLIAAVCLVSCMKETPVEELHTQTAGGELISVKVGFSGMQAVTKSGYSASETALRNLTLMVFASDGSLSACTYTDDLTEDAVLSIPTGTYTFAAAANLGDLRSEVGSLSDWQSLTANITTAMLNDAFPMSGSVSKTVSASSTTVNIPLERLVAKYTLELDRSDILEGVLTLKGVTLRNVAKVVRPASCWGVTSSSQIASSGDSATAADVTSLNGDGSAVFYVPENRQGIETSITSSGDKIPSHPFTSVFSGLCTYLEVYCTYYDGESEIYDITYRMYLGGNATTDFNVTRNTAYTITLCPCSDNIRDATWKCENELLATVSLYSGVTSSALSRRWVNAAQNVFLAVTDQSGAVIPIRSCTSSNGAFSSSLATRTIDGKEGTCANLIIAGVGSMTYHVKTTTGLEFDFPMTAYRPNISVATSNPTLFLDGSAVHLACSWTTFDGETISNPSTFFNATAAKAIFVDQKPSLSSTIGYRCVNNSVSMKSSISSANLNTVTSCIEAYFSSVSSLSTLYLRVKGFLDGQLKSVMDALQTGGYFSVMPTLDMSSSSFICQSSFTCMLPWFNRSTQIWDDLHDYSLIPEEYLASGLSHSGTVSTVFLPVRLSSSAITVNCALSNAYSSSYSSGVTYTIPAYGRSLTYSFSGKKHPAGRHTLTVPIRNSVSGETVSLNNGYLECYTHAAVGPEVDIMGMSRPWYDSSVQETYYDVSLALYVRFLWTCTSAEDYPLYLMEYRMKTSSAAKAMVQGYDRSSSGHYSYIPGKGIDTTVADITYPELDRYPGSADHCNLILAHQYSNGSVTASGDLGPISNFENENSQDGLFPLSCYYTESQGRNFRLYDYTGTTTVGSPVNSAHWYYNASCKDAEGKGYYIVDKCWNVSNRYSWTHYYYGLD